MSGAFQAAAIALHAHGLAVIPTGGDDGKTPLVGGWSAWKGQGRPTVETFAKKYPGANVAVLTGLSKLTVVDADDEETLADAEGRFGRSPIVTRSPRGGGHLYFKSSGERNANLRPDGLNVDIRGVGGLVLAPPSVRAGVGAYRIERGSWDDLATLPTVKAGAIPERRALSQKPSKASGTQTATAAGQGERNSALFTALRYQADACNSLQALIVEAQAINSQYIPPLPTTEAEKVARSVWRLKLEGRIILPGQQRILMLPAELDALGADAFYLAAWIKRWHGAKAGGLFALSPKAMEKAKVLPGWGRRRYGIAISLLCAAKFLTRIHKGGRTKGDPSLYCLGAPSGPNVTRHPRRPSPPGVIPLEQEKQKRPFATVPACRSRWR